MVGENTNSNSANTNSNARTVVSRIVAVGQQQNNTNQLRILEGNFVNSSSENNRRLGQEFNHLDAASIPGNNASNATGGKHPTNPSSIRVAQNNEKKGCCVIL